MSDPSVRAFVRARLRPGDLAVHAVVAAVLVGTYLAIPYEAVLFRPGRSGLAGAYLSLVGHATVAHLAGNVVGFLLLSALGRSLLAPRRRFYYAAFLALFVLVAPIGALTIEPLVARTAPETVVGYRGAGFSLLTAAFAGLVAVALAVHARDRLGGSISPALSAPALCSAALAVAAIRYDAPLAATVALSVLGLAGVGYAVSVLVSAYGERPDLEVLLSMTALLTFLGAASDLFPPRRGFVGIESHLVGLVSGFVIVWVLWALTSVVVGHRDGKEKEAS